MRKLLAAAALTVAVLSAPATLLAGDQDFTLVNSTGYQIDEVYLATPQSNSWGKDIMGDGVLENKAKKLVKFKPSTSACEWQMAVKFEDGETVVWEKPFDLCKIETLTLMYNKSSGVTSAKAE